MNARIQDMAGRRFANLTAICVAGKASSGDLKWEFLCDCGNQFVANGYYARCGKITTCPACSTNRSRDASVTHGLSESPEFSVWTDIQTRCHNPNSTSYGNYGGRGIVVCKRWRESFETFLADMGKRPEDMTIERNNTNGNYEPSNCRWATRIEQANNKRNNLLVTIDGLTKTLSQWAAFYGVQVGTASLRHKQGLRGDALFKTTKLTITHDGVTDTVRGWSKRTGIKPSTIGMRVHHYNWPASRALTEGAKL